MTDVTVRPTTEPTSFSDPPEVEEVTTTRVACDGGTLGHPRVWLQIDPATGFVECGYCDKRYVLKEGAGDH